MFHVVLKEVPLHADVLGLLGDQGIPKVSDGALAVLPYGGCSAIGFVEDHPHELAKVESLLGGVCCIVVLGLAGGLSDASLLLRLVALKALAECKQVARTGLAHTVVIGLVGIREANKMEVVIGSPPTSAAVGVCL
jgi:hypothetical protein